MGSHRVGHDWSDLAAVAAAAEYSMWNAGLDEAQAGIKSTGKNVNKLRYADDLEKQMTTHSSVLAWEFH